MFHKLGKAMGQRDDRYTLEELIEIGEGYFTIEASREAYKTQKGAEGARQSQMS